jgi:hypothetical protein
VIEIAWITLMFSVWEIQNQPEARSQVKEEVEPGFSSLGSTFKETE